MKLIDITACVSSSPGMGVAVSCAFFCRSYKDCSWLKWQKKKKKNAFSASVQLGNSDLKQETESLHKRISVCFRAGACLHMCLCFWWEWFLCYWVPVRPCWKEKILQEDRALFCRLRETVQATDWMEMHNEDCGNRRQSLHILGGFVNCSGAFWELSSDVCACITLDGNSEHLQIL